MAISHGVLTADPCSTTFVFVSTRDELEAFNRGFTEALARRDVDRIVEMYADDAVLLFHGMPIVRGRSEIEAMFREDLADGPSTIRFEVGDVIEDGSIVIDVGRYETPDGRGKYVVVYRRRTDGSLELVVDSATSDGSNELSEG